MRFAKAYYKSFLIEVKEFWGMKYNRLGVLRLQNQTCQWELNSRDYSIVDKIVKSHDVNFQIKYSRFEAAFSSSNSIQVRESYGYFL